MVRLLRVLGTMTWYVMVAHIGKQKHIRDGECWLVNSGLVAGIDAIPTWILGDLSNLSFHICKLPEVR